MKTCFALLSSLSLLAAGAAAQDTIYHLGPPVGPDALAPEVLAAGDVNGDGHADVLVRGLTTGVALAVISGRDGTALEQVALAGNEVPLLLVDLDGDGLMEFVGTTSFYASGDVTVRQGGPSGATLFQVPAPEGSVSFGGTVVVVGDLDLDGVLDLAIPAPSDAAVWRGQLVSGLGRIFVHSGADGSLLFERASPAVAEGQIDQLFSTAVAGLGDVDGDGRPDLAVGSKGRAWVLSGADGHVVHSLGGFDFQAHYGTRLDGAGDVDDDGVEDVIVGAPQTWIESPPGYAHVYSGQTGALIHAFAGASGDFFGAAVSGAGDVDGDGHADLLVGASQRLSPWVGTGRGYVRAFSGETGEELFTVAGLAQNGGFGAEVAGLGDVDGDGAPDFAAARGLVLEGAVEGAPARVLSTRPLMLTADQHLVDLGDGGTQTLEVDAGPEHAGATMLVLGTASGRTPGVEVLGQALPLNLDAWLLFTAAHPNGAIAGSLQPLDAAGRAEASLAVPPLAEPALVGLTLDHAVLVLDGGAGVAASHAVPLTLVD